MTTVARVRREMPREAEMETNGQAGHISVDAASKSYTRNDQEQLVLDRASFSTGAGNFTSLVGPSGCGKTTLLRMIAGLVMPTEGQVRIGNERVNGPRRDIGLVFQSPNLLPWRNVLRNVLLPVEVQGKDVKAYRDRAHDLLAMVGLQGCAEMHPWELSGGMQQRVGICRALIHDPAVLLMDEPFAALDAMTRDSMNDEILRIWASSNKTIVFVTHSIAEAVYLSDEIVVMDTGPGRVRHRVRITVPRPERSTDGETIQLTAWLRSIFSHDRADDRAAVPEPADSRRVNGD